jgi:DNA (cytosine-5)-methyltransferase 1
LEGVSRTLSARYFKDGSEILIPQGLGKNPRRLTPNECARLMGYDPEKYKVIVSDSQAYRQFGNSLVPAIAEAIGREVVKTLCWQMRANGHLLPGTKLSA